MSRRTPCSQRVSVLTLDPAAVAEKHPVEIQAVGVRFVTAHELRDIVDTLQDKELVDVEKRKPRRLMLERLQEMQIDFHLLADAAASARM